jgi:predicted CoA-binding protein
MRVAVLGASPNPDRYSNKAVRQLLSHGHEVVPVNPGHKTVEGLPAVPTLAAVTGAVDTVTVYVSPSHLTPLIPALVALKPRRVIANPGAESAELEMALERSGIAYIEACTLVMLATGQF